MAIQKDYKAIANIIKETPIDIDTDTTTTVERFRFNIAQNIANYLASRNEFFNKNTFLDTCIGE